MSQEQDTKQALSSSPIWRTTWSIKLYAEAELFTLLYSSWNHIITNLNKFSQGKILKVYSNTTSTTEYETTNITSTLIIYSSVNCMLDHSAITNHLRKQSQEFNCLTHLWMKPIVVKQINIPDFFSEIIQKKPEHVIVTDLKAIAEHEHFSRSMVDLE
jgi:hypothetical protein